jgi:hypothetical protein
VAASAHKVRGREITPEPDVKCLNRKTAGKAHLMAQQQTRPTEAVIKRLFAVSGNRCAYPNCTTQIVQGSSVIGEICHIQAASPNGPRHDPLQTSADRRGHGNLILLCPTHHKVIDDDTEAYTVERLRKMKLDHEKRSTTLGANEVDRGTRLLMDQSVVSINQSGGITAHTVHQTINVQPPEVRHDAAAERASIISRLRDFHDDRVKKIKAGSAPVAVLADGTLVMHVLPFSAAYDEQASAFDEISGSPERFPPIGRSGGAYWKIGYEGLLIGSNSHGLSEPQRAYVMVFRSGAVEAVVSSLAKGYDDEFLILPEIEAIIIEYACLYGQALATFRVEPPLAVFLSIIDVEGKTLLQDSISGGAFSEDLPSGAIDRSCLRFRECVFDSTPTDHQGCAKLLKPVLDHLANVAGLPSSRLFDSAGTYVGQ